MYGKSEASRKEIKRETVRGREKGREKQKDILCIMQEKERNDKE